jgi:hypothetical protein
MLNDLVFHKEMPGHFYYDNFPWVMNVMPGNCMDIIKKDQQF